MFSGYTSTAQIPANLLILIYKITTSDRLMGEHPLKPETARRLRGRIEAVLDYAREPDDSRPNPAAWSGWLKPKLGEQSKTKLDKKTGERIPRGHHAAMRWQDVSAFVAKLRTMDSAASRALEFLILTASRTGEVIDMPWNEVELVLALDKALKPTWSSPPTARR